MPPMLIGHSQGGMQAVKILHVLNGGYAAEVPVWNPLTDFPESRTTIVDPLTGRPVPVVGLRISYASAVGAGGAAFLLPNQWTLVGRLRTIPDTVEEFTGYWIDVDLWAWTFPGADATRKFENSGHVKVRNVTLPASNNHVTLPVTADLAEDPAIRAWIDAYRPGGAAPPAERRRQRAVGGRRLVQREEALGAGGAAADPRPARRQCPGRGRQVRIAVLPVKGQTLAAANRSSPRVRPCGARGPEEFQTMADALAGKVALVTGAARGIGRAIAPKLAAEGCDVAVNYYNSADEAEALCARDPRVRPPRARDPGQRGHSRQRRRDVRRVPASTSTASTSS